VGIGVCFDILCAALTYVDQRLQNDLPPEDFKRIADARRTMWTGGLIGFATGAALGFANFVAYREYQVPVGRALACVSAARGRENSTAPRACNAVAATCRAAAASHLAHQEPRAAVHAGRWRSGRVRRHHH
jgi:hypothetical protein